MKIRYSIIVMFLIVLFLGSLYFVLQSRKGETFLSPVFNNIPLLSTPKISSLYNITRTSYENEELFSLVGTLENGLFYENDFLMGDFYLEGDPDRSPIRILTTSREGNFIVGTVDKDTTNFTVVGASELQEAVAESRKVELRIIVRPTTAQREEILSDLESLTKDKNIEPLEYALNPQMIQVLP